MVSAANLELIDTEVCRAQLTRSQWNPSRAQRCTSGVTLLSAANMEFSAAPPSPSAVKMELLAASAAEQELRPPAEAVNSIFAASVADNSIFAALSERAAPGLRDKPRRVRKRHNGGFGKRRIALHSQRSTFPSSAAPRRSRRHRPHPPPPATIYRRTNTTASKGRSSTDPAAPTAGASW